MRHAYRSCPGWLAAISKPDLHRTFGVLCWLHLRCWRPVSAADLHLEERNSVLSSPQLWFPTSGCRSISAIPPFICIPLFLSPIIASLKSHQRLACQPPFSRIKKIFNLSSSTGPHLRRNTYLRNPGCCVHPHKFSEKKNPSKLQRYDHRYQSADSNATVLSVACVFEFRTCGRKRTQHPPRQPTVLFAPTVDDKASAAELCASTFHFSAFFFHRGLFSR